MINAISKLKKYLYFPKDCFPYLVFLFFALFLVSEFFSSGYILTLDTVFSENAFRISSVFYGLSNSYSVVPFFAILKFLNILISGEFIQKLSYFLIFSYQASLRTSYVLRN